MNALTKDLMSLTEAAERNAVSDGRFRQKFHLMPPVGWLNDPTDSAGTAEFITPFFSILLLMRKAA